MGGQRVHAHLRRPAGGGRAGRRTWPGRGGCSRPAWWASARPRSRARSRRPRRCSWPPGRCRARPPRRRRRRRSRCSPRPTRDGRAPPRRRLVDRGGRRRRRVGLGARRRARRGVRLAGGVRGQRAAVRGRRAASRACCASSRGARRRARLSAPRSRSRPGWRCSCSGSRNVRGPRWPAPRAALAAFALLERRGADPILPAWTLRRPAFGAATAVAFASTSRRRRPAMFLAILYQQEDARPRRSRPGLWCVPFNLAVIAGSLLGPRLRGRRAMHERRAGRDRRPARWCCSRSRPPRCCRRSCSWAAGSACRPWPRRRRARPRCDDEQGIASGVLNAAAQIGTALGVAVVVPLGFRGGFAAAAAIALAAAAATRSCRRSRRRPTTPRR